MSTREKILIVIIMIILPWLTIREVNAESGNCLTQTMINTINHEYIASVNNDELALLYKEKEEFLNNIKSLPSTAKFGKSGKVNHIKHRIEEINYRIASKEKELSYHKKFASK